MAIAAHDADRWYRALRARDPRFDGVFFVGVTTTGIYCRPICPARIPLADRCRYFSSAAQAEAAQFRACLRCRPELAPGHGSVDSIGDLARGATAEIETGYLDHHSVDDLAERFGVSARHLRRACETELGVAPNDLAQTRRLALAKQLLHDTGLDMSAVAFAAGFASLRRFNAAFRERFGRPPSAVRHALAPTPRDDGAVRLRLDLRPPYDHASLVAFLAARAIPGVEQVSGDRYRRSVAVDGHRGWLELRPSRRASTVEVEISTSLLPRLALIVARVRSLVDADAHPRLIAEHLERDRTLRPALRRFPGLRVPGGFDGFELAVRSILGQQVSVAAATTLSGRLVERWGEPNPGAPPGIDRTFPTAARLAELGAAAIATIGLPAARAATIARLAEATVAGTVGFHRGGDPRATIAALEALPGIGPWTAHYLAMRALRWPDAFPSGDLVLRRGLRVETARAAERHAEAWRPWRAYAAMYLWKSHAAGG